uniref:AAA+ ATPase domain-containing protein n=1 Tax=Leersia perrieri TaxID=77586 RepID=A0A0D9WF18_9ORYZ
MAMILDAFMPTLGRVVAEVVKEQLDMLLGVADEMKRLERKRFADTAVEDWVRDLKDVMYDADDLLDLWRLKSSTVASTSQRPARSPRPRCCVPLLTCFRNPATAHAIAGHVKELNQRLEVVSKRSSMFHFVRAAAASSSSQRRHLRLAGATKTSPVIVHGDLLTSDDPRDNVVVLAITGAGGIGKTTLAKRVFDDQRVRDEFERRVWVCVSQDVDEADLLRSVILGTPTTATDELELDGGARDRSWLEPALQRALSGKKVLLVMDDVWSDAPWNAVLRDAFRSGAGGGSRVLVTTRNDMVAMRMKALHPHHVNKLLPEDGWRLLKNQEQHARLDSAAAIAFRPHPPSHSPRRKDSGGEAISSPRRSWEMTSMAGRGTSSFSDWRAKDSGTSVDGEQQRWGRLLRGTRGVICTAPHRRRSGGNGAVVSGGFPPDPAPCGRIWPLVGGSSRKRWGNTGGDQRLLNG